MIKLFKFQWVCLLSIMFVLFSCNRKDYTYQKHSFADKDLAFYIVKGEEKNIEFKVYFDENNENAAMEAISHLLRIYREILKFHISNGEKINWADVAFVNDANYLAPAFGTTRWIIQNRTDNLSQKAENQIYDLIGHEQVHALQEHFVTCDDLPRWFEEGQAVWSEFKVTRNLQPELFEALLNSRKKQYDSVIKADGKLNLASWGGIAVKPESIIKQLTPEGKKYFDENGRTPPGATFNISPQDMIEDNVNQSARYYGSYLLFKRLEEKMGVENLKEWVYDTLQNIPCESEVLVKKLKERYKVDISKELS
ncbi:hypothetical protein [Maribacter sp. IgM3_T14_3]|uniref:hypothetical protein n=1 Tax=Maribacter sp. IgM3_T14_3 TaxID=3415140 RepID=UPI003C700FD2